MLHRPSWDSVTGFRLCRTPLFAYETMHRTSSAAEHPFCKTQSWNTVLHPQQIDALRPLYTSSRLMFHRSFLAVFSIQWENTTTVTKQEKRCWRQSVLTSSLRHTQRIDLRWAYASISNYLWNKSTTESMAWYHIPQEKMIKIWNLVIFELNEIQRSKTDRSRRKDGSLLLLI